MEDNYDFSKGIRSPFVLKDNGMSTVRIHYDSSAEVPEFDDICPVNAKLLEKPQED